MREEKGKKGVSRAAMPVFVGGRTEQVETRIIDGYDKTIQSRNQMKHIPSAVTARPIQAQFKF